MNLARDRIAHQFGLAVIAGIEASTAAEEAQTRVNAIAQERGAAFEALEACIQSGQVPQEDAQSLIASVPGFADWRAQRRPQVPRPHPSDTTAVPGDMS